MAARFWTTTAVCLVLPAMMLNACGRTPDEPAEPVEPAESPELASETDAEDAAAPPEPAPEPRRRALQDRAAMVEGATLGAAPSPALTQAAEIAPPAYGGGDLDRDAFPDADPNPVKLVTDQPVSTFSVDVDTASYAFVRANLNDGVLPARDAVRVEEVINYFDYDYPLPDDRSAPFAVSTTVTPSPWAEERRLIHIGLKGFDLEPQERPRANLVFLLDVSGSMGEANKLPLLKRSLALLVEELEPEDTIAIAVYAGAAGTVLEPTPVAEKGKILAALEQLNAGGSTAGGEGLRLAYALAEQNFDAEALNRVILATDGDFNVGVTSDERLEDFVARKRDSGVYLSVLGFGRGNYNDRLMQTIAQAGNGQAAYIDTLNEARKALVDDLDGALFPIAQDVKIQVEFNPARVAEYRLIGYETRLLNREDFNNDAVDAGEIGAGHQVTAIYEIAAPGSAGRLIDDSRYGDAAPVADGPTSDELAFLRLRYKLPGEDESRLIERPIADGDAVEALDDAPAPTRFAIAAAAFAQLLRAEPHLGDYGYDDVLALAQSARGEDPFGYRAEFVQLVRAAEGAAALPTLERPDGGGE